MLVHSATALRTATTVPCRRVINCSRHTHTLTRCSLQSRTASMASTTEPWFPAQAKTASTDKCLSSPVTSRNREPILEVLRTILPAETPGKVVEVASGSGEHIVFLAKAFPNLTWQPSDVDTAALESIAAWTVRAQASNVLPPISLDSTQPDAWPSEMSSTAIAVCCINMLHISMPSACEGLLKGASKLLQQYGFLYIYGPFKLHGQHTSPGNVHFDATLKTWNKDYGIKDVDDVAALAVQYGLYLQQRIDMPANNMSLLFQKRQQGQ